MTHAADQTVVAKPDPARVAAIFAETDRLTRAEALSSVIGEYYARIYGIERDDLWHLAKLTEELGELNSAWLSANGRGRDRGLSPEALAQAVEDEAADLFGFLLLFAERNQIDLESALRRKWGKYLAPHSDAK